MASVMFYHAMYTQVFVIKASTSTFYRNEPLPVSLKGVVKTEDIRSYATYEMEHKYEDDSHNQAQSGRVCNRISISCPFRAQW